MSDAKGFASIRGLEAGYKIKHMMHLVLGQNDSMRESAK